MINQCVMLGLCLAVSEVFALTPDRISLGRLEVGGEVSFVKAAEGDWGIEIACDASPVRQAGPIRIEVFQSDETIAILQSGYKTVQLSASEMDARAEITYNGNVVFHVHDHWRLKGSVLSVHRKIDVEGTARGGFNSSVVLNADPSVKWSDVNYLAPGALYRDPNFAGDRSPGGTMNYTARRFIMREDMLPAPLFALSFNNGFSVAILDASPRGDTTLEESKLQKAAMTDARFQFGALGVWQDEKAPIAFGFWFPGSEAVYGGGPNTGSQPRWIRRYHPIDRQVNHSYDINFRFGRSESFRDMMRNTWRWAWNTLNPETTYIDVEQMRRILTDHLVEQAATIDGRTAIPFVLSTVETSQRQWNWTMAAMGFVGKNIECADQLLAESRRDNTKRGQEMRRIALGIITSMIQALPTVPLQGTGYDLATGKPWDHIWVAPWLRNATEDMAVLMRIYRREYAQGRLHPEWLTWLKTYADWLILQQREDGSFPRRWEPGSNKVAESTGTTSYCPVPLLVMMTGETGDAKYQESAIRAAEYVWTNWGINGFFVGGASDNPNITDKEAGMLSMEAYLSLYDSTKDSKWLQRAQVAADFAETWIWIWNLPMPLDADDAQLHWKKGVPTIGLQGITARVAGSVDEYLSWAVPSYAKLYKYTGDQHYLDVARILLHNTKSMVAIPGRQYDMKGIGWQQENWRMGPGGAGRGVGAHRFWLPWISANHLHGITGLEELDPNLYQMLGKENKKQRN